MATSTFRNLTRSSMERTTLIAPPKPIYEPLKPKPKAKVIKFERRTPKKGEAPAKLIGIPTAHYHTGDGDILAIRRPGSDHSHLKSFGTLT